MPTGEARSPTTEPMLQDGTAEAAFAAQQDADAEALSDRYIEDAIVADRDRTTDAIAERAIERIVDAEMKAIVQQQVDRDFAFARAAPTKTPAKPNKATWRDWLPPGAPEPTDLLTRAEVLEQLRRRREDITERELRRWEYEGALPRAVRQGRTGVARYPDWYVPLAKHVRHLRRLGFSLDQIRRRSRAYARYVLGINDEPNNPLDEEIRSHALGPIVAAPDDVDLPEPAKTGLRRLAQWHERVTGVPTDHVDVWVVDAEGNQTRYPLSIADEVRWVSTGSQALTLLEASAGVILN